MVLTLLFAFQNCGSSEGEFKNAPSGKLSESDLQAKLTQIENLVQTNLTCTKDEDCENIRIGGSGCGGPLADVIVSTLNSEIEQIKREGDILTQMYFDYFAQNNLAGACVYKYPPVPKCELSLCKAE